MMRLGSLTRWYLGRAGATSLLVRTRRTSLAVVAVGTSIGGTGSGSRSLLGAGRRRLVVGRLVGFGILVGGA